MSAPAALLANLGAEEGPAWRRHARLAPVRDAAALWALLFPPHTPRLDADAAPEPIADWLRDATGQALEPLSPGAGALVPWLVTEEARDLARERGLALFGPDPRIVRRVHDKAFAIEHARGHGALEAACAVLEPDAADSVASAAETRVAGWPTAWRSRFTLKPRLGTTGRGRIPGIDGRVDRAALRRAPQGAGFVVEPWVERIADASTQLWVDGAGGIQLLGQLQLDVTADGRCTGFTEAGSSAAGGMDLPRLRDAAVDLASAAARQGYTGPCSVDAFAWRDASGELQTRAIVELNARFSLGIAALGLFARARRAGLELARPRLRRARRVPRSAALHILGGYWLDPAGPPEAPPR